MSQDMTWWSKLKTVNSLLDGKGGAAKIVGSVEYAYLNGDQPEVNQDMLEVNHQDHHDLE